MANKPKTAVVSELDIATQDNAMFDSEIDNPVNTEMGDTPRTPGGNPLRGMQEIRAYTNMSIFGTAEEADNVEHLEEIRQQKKWCGLLHPETPVSQVYNQIQMLFLVYLLIVLPYRIAFDIAPPVSDIWFWVDTSIDLSIVFDIVLNMNRYLFDKTGKIITDKKTIRLTYMRSWFAIDTISVFPFDYFVMLVDYIMNEGDADKNAARAARLLRLGRMARFARLTKLTKLTKLKECTKIIKEFLQNIGVSLQEFEFLLRVLGLVMIVFAVAHMFACLWLHNGRATLDEDAGWMWSQYSTVSTEYAEDARDHMFERGTWRDMSQYTDSVYWVLVTMSSVGYGDFLPTTKGERRFACVLIVFAAFLNAYIIGAFSAIMASMKHDSARYDTKMRQIHEFLKFLDVPMDLVNKITAFYEHKYVTKTMFDDHEIMDELPSRIRSDLVLHRFQHVVNRVPFFRGCRDDAIVDICTQLKSQAVMPGDLIIHAGDPYRELVILTRGAARTFSEDEHSVYAEKAKAGAAGKKAMKHALKEAKDIENRKAKSGRASPGRISPVDAVICYSVGSFFGELEFLGFSQERHTSVIATHYSEVCTLHPTDIESILGNHIKLRHRLQRYGKLNSELTKTMEEKGHVDIVEVEQLKQRIEDSFEDQSHLKEAFDKVDVGTDGTLSREQFSELIHSLAGTKPSAHQLDVVMLEIAQELEEGFLVTKEAFLDWWDETDGDLPKEDSELQNTQKMLEQQQQLSLQILEAVQALSQRVANLEK